jgi:lipoprotein-anchoring transpeptidase ErfK/SrfK
MKKLILLLLFVLSSLFIVTPVHAADIITSDKLITVDLGSQTLRAWEGGQIKHETKISSGMKLTPTVRGSFKIRTKVPMQDMRGPSPYKQYYPTGKYLVKNVPHVMYFYQAYAIHGAYWHNNFGRPASHGCVNVPLASAEWLYNWAGVGTRVEVY